MRWLKPEIDEVLPGLIGTTEICHPAFEDETDFVEVLIQGFPSLIDGYDSGETCYISSDPQGADKFKGGGGIETPS